MKFERIGKHLRLVDVRNQHLAVANLLGINIEKRFVPSVADVSETDLSRYKVIKRNQFAFSPMQVGRDETIRVVLYTYDKPAIITPAYFVFEVIDEKVLLPEFLMLYFKRPETNRYGWFISDGSVRSSLEWERFCDIEIPVPSIETQRENVSLYNGMLRKQDAYEKSLTDLELISNTYLDALIESKKNESIGTHVKLIDCRNDGAEITNVLGINIKKEFIQTVANVSETDLSKYKVIKKGQFAFSHMQVGRDETIRVALFTAEHPAIISPAYSVFEVINADILLPEFLMMYFNRPETDRYGWFISDGTVRSSLEWERFCDIKIPLPTRVEQERIVTIHHVLEKRKNIAKQSLS